MGWLTSCHKREDWMWTVRRIEIQSTSTPVFHWHLFHCLIHEWSLLLWQVGNVMNISLWPSVKLSYNTAISHLNMHLENDLWRQAGHMIRRLLSWTNDALKAILLSPLSRPSILFANYNSRIYHSFQCSLYQEFTLHIFFLYVVL